MYSGGRRSTERRGHGCRHRTRGLSLLEALAATGFLSAALLALVVNSISLTRHAKNADSVSAASALALQKLEQLRSTPLGASQLTPGQYYDPANPLKADGTSGGPFSRSWTVSVNDSPSFGLKTVTVEVAWTDSRPHWTQVAAYVRCSTVPCS
jgi:Tfp pilus assembly protein PilV